MENTRACSLVNLYKIRKGTKTPSEKKKLFLETSALKSSNKWTPITYPFRKGTSNTRF